MVSLFPAPSSLLQADSPVKLNRLQEKAKALAELPSAGEESESEEEESKGKSVQANGGPQENCYLVEWGIPIKMFGVISNVGWLRGCSVDLAVGSKTLIPEQEYKTMKKLGDSLLARSAKVTDLMSKLENAAEEMPDGSMEKKRITRPGVETTNTEP